MYPFLCSILGFMAYYNSRHGKAVKAFNFLYVTLWE
jgi:hypothetical protein